MHRLTMYFNVKCNALVIIGPFNNYNGYIHGLGDTLPFHILRLPTPLYLTLSKFINKLFKLSILGKFLFPN